MTCKASYTDSRARVLLREALAAGATDDHARIYALTAMAIARFDAAKAEAAVRRVWAADFQITDPN